MDQYCMKKPTPAPMRAAVSTTNGTRVRGKFSSVASPSTGYGV